MRTYFVLVMFLRFLDAPRNTFAQSAQVQPIMGLSWPFHSIPVSIAPSKPNGRQAVLNAIVHSTIIS